MLTRGARRGRETLSRIWRRCRAALGTTSWPHGTAGGGQGGTAVDRYWAEFTVRAEPFPSAEASLAYLEWRFQQYPLFGELMRLYGDHTGEVVLDYGCGPGNDLVGFLALGKAAKVVGVDISAKALALAATRLQLHTTDPARVELIRITDSQTELPIRDATIDYVYSGGVIHHTSDPVAILRELQRVLRPGREGCIMVYNRDSIWFHLHAAYIKTVLERAYPGLSVEEVFAKTTDTETCPIARAYTPGDFGTLLQGAGFEWEFVGGYLSTYELDILAKHRRAAESDRRLPDEHRDFLRELTTANGYPRYRGKYAGIGGVYRLRKSG